MMINNIIDCIFRFFCQELDFFRHLEYPYEETLARAHRRAELMMCSYLPIFSSFKITKGFVF